MKEDQADALLNGNQQRALTTRFRGSYPKRVLLIINDGQDNNSRYSYGELRRSLAESGIIVYAVGDVLPAFM